MLDVRIVTPKSVAYTGKASDVQAPGELGEFGVLPQHIPFLTTLKPGVVTVRGPEGTRKFKVGAGFAEAGPDRVVILAETCESI
ncbi:MAG: ATP synthase F1 subunit epsilon [Myxococcota bacterium]